jgi:hypothetical protein
MKSSISSNSRNARLITVFLLAAVLFNFPLLGIFTQPYFIGKFPVLLTYLFVVWGGIIFLTANLVERKTTQKKHKTNQEDEF